MSAKSVLRENVLTAEDAFNRICQIETKYDLLQFKVDGWCIWPLLRFTIAWWLTTPHDTSPRSAISNLVRGQLVLEDIFRMICLPRAMILAKTYTSGLVDRTGGYYKDIWFDDLLQVSGEYFKIENVNSIAFMEKRSRALIRSDLTSTCYETFAILLARLGIGGSNLVKQISSEISECVRNELGLSQVTLSYVAKRIVFFLWLKHFYSSLLQRVCPKYVLTADPGEYALIAAARERSIKVIEVQHGITDRYHAGYMWTTYALQYKARMPIPNYIFLYGSHWKQELAGSGFWGDSLRVVGNPRIDQYRARRRKETIAHNGKQVLVLTTQGLDVNSLISFINKFLKIASKQPNIRLYIKLHPIYEKDKTVYVSSLGSDSRVTILLGSEAPSTFDLLMHADFHLSISSMSHYDALGLGVPTVILPLISSRTVYQLYENGHASMAHSPQELFEIVTRVSSTHVPPEVSDYYFCPDALGNMKRELELA